MKFPSAKKALSILIVCFFVELGVGLLTGILEVIPATATVGGILEVALPLAIGVATIVAYGIGGKDNGSFHTAFVIEIFSLILGVVAVVFSLVGSFVPSQATWTTYGVEIANVLSNVITIACFFYVCQACGEVSREEKITKLANTACIWYGVAVIIEAIAKILDAFLAASVDWIAGLCAVLAIIGMIVAEIIKLVLIFKAHKACK